MKKIGNEVLSMTRVANNVICRQNTEIEGKSGEGFQGLLMQIGEKSTGDVKEVKLSKENLVDLVQLPPAEQLEKLKEMEDEELILLHQLLKFTLQESENNDINLLSISELQDLPELEAKERKQLISLLLPVLDKLKTLLNKKTGENTASDKIGNILNEIFGKDENNKINSVKEQIKDFLNKEVKFISTDSRGQKENGKVNSARKSRLEDLLVTDKEADNQNSKNTAKNEIFNVREQSQSESSKGQTGEKTLNLRKFAADEKKNYSLQEILNPGGESRKSWLMGKMLTDKEQDNRKLSTLLKNFQSEVENREYIKIEGKHNLKDGNDFTDFMKDNFLAEGRNINYRPGDTVNYSDRMKEYKIFQQVEDKINIRKLTGNKVLELKLEPDFLGKVSIKLESEAGNMKAGFIVENEFVKNYLENNISVLQNNLTAKNINFTEINIESEHHNLDHNSARGNSEQENNSNQNEFNAEQSWREGYRHPDKEEQTDMREKWKKAGYYLHDIGYYGFNYLA